MAGYVAGRTTRFARAAGLLFARALIALVVT